MFNDIKEIIKEVAIKAVNYAEETLGTSTGKEKKRTAIEFIVSRLPVAPVFKKVIAILLSKFIDESVEFAVQYMNKNKGGLDGRDE